MPDEEQDPQDRGPPDLSPSFNRYRYRVEIVIDAQVYASEHQFPRLVGVQETIRSDIYGLLDSLPGVQSVTVTAEGAEPASPGPSTGMP